jgi:D-alanyl-D-alanine carboxypeptidase (penicillin-binding protein 5/6)
VLIDAATGRVLYEKDADRVMPIASTTKIMTALTALEYVSPDDIVTIPDEAAGTEGSSMYAKAGQTYPVGDILNGLMLLSGNDAAAALAIHCAGSVEDFAAAMNRKAAELGMTNTVFKNPHGLWDENFSTARDMALLARAAMTNEEFKKIVKQKYGVVGDISVRNHNRLLWTLPGCDGLKTGFTKLAGRCLVSSAEREGARFVAVTLKDSNDWADHTKMHEYAFAEYKPRVFCEPGYFCDVNVMFGAKSQLRLVSPQGLTVPLTDGEARRVTVKVTVPRYLCAPIVGGRGYGEISVWLDGELLARTVLVAEKAMAIDN